MVLGHERRRESDQHDVHRPVRWCRLHTSTMAIVGMASDVLPRKLIGSPETARAINTLFVATVVTFIKVFFDAAVAYALAP